MHSLHKLFLSISKVAETRCALVKRNCVLFYLIIVLREGNQARSELFSKIALLFNAMYAVSRCQSVYGMQRKI